LVLSLTTGFGRLNVRVISRVLPTRFRNPVAVMRYVAPGTNGVAGETVTTIARSGGGAFGFGGGGP
jgi:hypothetical protein